MPRLSIPPKAQFFLGIIAPTLLLFKLESGEGLTIYTPQRYCAYDQSAITKSDELSTLRHVLPTSLAPESTSSSHC